MSVQSQLSNVKNPSLIFVILLLLFIFFFIYLFTECKPLASNALENVSKNAHIFSF